MNSDKYYREGIARGDRMGLSTGTNSQTQDRIENRYDVVIVGGRVAGAATALLLARAGLSVLVLERSAPGSDTLSTLALMRAGVMQLHRWGLLNRIRAAGTPAIRRTTFHYGEESFAVDIQERDGVDALFAPRRTVLDAALAEAARESGAHVLHRATVTSLLRDRSDRIRGVIFTGADGVSRRVESGIVIGADGVHSRVASAVGAEVLRKGRTRSATIYGYWRGMEVDGTHWHFVEEFASGAVPTNDGLTCVFVSMRPDRYQSASPAEFDRLFVQSLSKTDPELASAVQSSKRVGKLYPFPGLTSFIRQSWGRGWALVGDAGVFKDPLTAHGITDALREAEMLANAVVAGSDIALRRYQMERDSFAAELLELSDEISSFDWDLDRVKLLHYRLSKLLNRECDLVRSFDLVPEELVCA